MALISIFQTEIDFLRRGWCWRVASEGVWVREYAQEALAVLWLRLILVRLRVRRNTTPSHPRAALDQP